MNPQKTLVPLNFPYVGRSFPDWISMRSQNNGKLGSTMIVTSYKREKFGLSIIKTVFFQVTDTLYNVNYLH